ncbi:MAG TPA: GntR family transcriptional regulator, partial [Anaerolineales bacterium]|nr:GntR family transcriptional regulator [Anaerolineales bacterium]
LIRSEQGRGTFVTAPTASPLSFMLNPFDEEMLRQHRQPSTRLISCEILPASPEVALRLELEMGEPVIKIIRLRLANERPIIYESRFLAQRLCPELVNEDLETQSIHSLLISKFHIPLTKITHTIEARLLPAQEAKSMQVREGTGAFFIDRLTYTIGEDGLQKPAVLYQAYYREHVYHFRAEFEAHL